MNRVLNGLILSLQFFTSIPINKNVTWDSPAAKWTIHFLPIIGGILGGLLLLQLYVLLNWTPIRPEVIAVWLLLFSIFFSGGIHLDGWIDTSDAYFSFRDKTRRLEIMSDSRVGAFGVISMFFLLLLRILFIYEILILNSEILFCYIIIIPFLSRFTLTTVFYKGQLAKDEGLAAHFKKYLDRNDLFFNYFLFLFVCILLLIVLPKVQLFTIIMFIFTLISSELFIKFFNRNFGGFTGDTLGAASEGQETLLYLLLYVFILGGK